MSIDLGNIYLISVFLILWFGLVGKIKTANRTETCSFSFVLVRFWTPCI